jgi:hypothetical protein
MRCGLITVKSKESDWELYLRIRGECCEARRNHNIREDLLERDIVKRFAKAIRRMTGSRKR